MHEIQLLSECLVECWQREYEHFATSQFANK